MPKGTTLSIHYATNIRVAEHYPENSQMITLRISQGLGLYHDVTIFDLPKDLVNKLLEAFPAQSIYRDENENEMAL